MNIWRISYARNPAHNNDIVLEWFATKGDATARQLDLGQITSGHIAMREFRAEVTSRAALVSFLNNHTPGILPG